MTEAILIIISMLIGGYGLMQYLTAETVFQQVVGVLWILVGAVHLCSGALAGLINHINKKHSKLLTEIRDAVTPEPPPERSKYDRPIEDE